MSQTVVLLLGTAILAAAAATAVALQRRARTRARLWGDTEDVGPRRELGRIARWLSLAGLRGAGAPLRFAAACVAAVGTAAALVLFLGQSPALLSAENAVAAIPVVGLPLARIVILLPWLSALLLSVTPVLVKDHRGAALSIQW